MTERTRKPCTGPGCTRTVETITTSRRPLCRPCRRRLGNLRIPHQRRERREQDRQRYREQKRAILRAA